jgi:trans-2-enoyl-CoA reductase
MKIVINRCWGGFGLSEAAWEMILDRKGIAWEKAPKEHKWGYAAYRDKNTGKEIDDSEYHYSYDLRNDPLLVEVVETLGEAADSDMAELEVVEIPDDVEWIIVDYDGMEHIAEKHRTWP